MVPGEDNGSFEDPFDAYVMIKNSGALQVILCHQKWFYHNIYLTIIYISFHIMEKNLATLFLFTVVTYNCMAVYVTKYLSAIWHAVLDIFRPVTIWALDLAIYYVFLPNQGFGEKWVPASWFQLAGLLILFLGTAVYNGSVKLVAFDDDDYEELSDGDQELRRRSLSMSGRSPLIFRERLLSNASVNSKGSIEMQRGNSII